MPPYADVPQRVNFVVVALDIFNLVFRAAGAHQSRLDRKTLSLVVMGDNRIGMSPLVLDG